MTTHGNPPDLVAEPIGSLYSTTQESDISHCAFDSSGLNVVVVTADHNSDRDLELQYFFKNPRGFRFLDEGDLIRYWISGAFPNGYHLFRVAAGGWIDQEIATPGMLSVTNALGTFQEWFICTTNGSISVISSTPPSIAERR